MQDVLLTTTELCSQLGIKLSVKDIRRLTGWEPAYKTNTTTFWRVGDVHTITLRLEGYFGALADKQNQQNADMDRETPLKSLELSVRSSNILKLAGIETVEDLVQRTANELLKIPTMGRKSFNEIQSSLKLHGLTLGSQ